MNCSDLFVASVSVSLGFYIGREIFKGIDRMADPISSWSSKRRWFSFMCVMVLTLVVICYYMETTFISF